MVAADTDNREALTAAPPVRHLPGTPATSWNVAYDLARAQGLDEDEAERYADEVVAS